MENASKALLMAGSMLIGIILLSLGVYIFGIMRDAKKLESSMMTEEQLVKYNQQFISYNKTRMYGTDLITLLNKAIDSNDRYKAMGDDYEINVYFKLKEEVNDVTVKYTWTGKTYKQETPNKHRGSIDYGFQPGTTYNLKQHRSKIDVLLAGKDIPNGTKVYSTVPNHEHDYTITYTGFQNFKRMIFKCTDVGYTETGRINSMTFEQEVVSQY